MVDLGSFSDPADYLVLMEAVKIAKTMRQNGYRVTDYDIPVSESDGNLDVFIRKNAQTSYHHTSTCQIVPGDGIRPSVIDGIWHWRPTYH